MSDYALEDLRYRGYHICRRRVVAYTDGSCLRNGWGSAQGGIGVSWGNEHDISEPLEGDVQTNQRAELMAVIRAIETHPDDDVGLEIRTDSRYVETWWRYNGWRNRSGKQVANLDLVEQLGEFLDETWRKIIVTHVPGHGTSRGNRRADALAREGALAQNRNRYDTDSSDDYYY